MTREECGDGLKGAGAKLESQLWGDAVEGMIDGRKTSISPKVYRRETPSATLIPNTKFIIWKWASMFSFKIQSGDDKTT